MQVVYQADSSIDAHLVRGLLEQQGVDARVTGEFLQGGVGELPAAGLVEVLVPDADVTRARTVVAEFEANLRDQDRTPGPGDERIAVADRASGERDANSGGVRGVWVTLGLLVLGLIVLARCSA